MADLPQFPTLEAALRWAVYGIAEAGETVCPPPFSRFQKRDLREFDDEPQVLRAPRYDMERRLRAYDASGQAGMIKSYLTRQQLEVRAHLAAQCLLGDQRASALKVLADHLLPRLDCGKVRRAVVHQIVRRYYGRKVTLRSIMERHDIGRHRLAVVQRRVVILLDVIRFQSEGPIYDYLRKMKVIL